MASCREGAAKIILHSPMRAYGFAFCPALDIVHFVPDAALMPFVGEQSLECCLQTGLPSVVMSRRAFPFRPRFFRSIRNSVQLSSDSVSTRWRRGSPSYHPWLSEGTEKDFTFQADFTDFVIDPIQEEVLVLVLDGLRPVLFELLVGFWTMVETVCALTDDR